MITGSGETWKRFFTLATLNFSREGASYDVSEVALIAEQGSVRCSLINERLGNCWVYVSHSGFTIEKNFVIVLSTEDIIKLVKVMDNHTTYSGFVDDNKLTIISDKSQSSIILQNLSLHEENGNIVPENKEGKRWVVTLENDVPLAPPIVKDGKIIEKPTQYEQFVTITESDEIIRIGSSLKSSRYTLKTEEDGNMFIIVESDNFTHTEEITAICDIDWMQSFDDPFRFILEMSDGEVEIYMTNREHIIKNPTSGEYHNAGYGSPIWITITDEDCIANYYLSVVKRDNYERESSIV